MADSVPISEEKTEKKRPNLEDVPLRKDGAWASAMQRLSKKESDRLLNTVDRQSNYAATLHGLLDATKARKEECTTKRWKVDIKGHTIILRDVFEKISVWVSKVVKIGDIAVQYDPVSAALPWAAVRLILQASVNDVEVFGFVVQSIESIANVIANCTILEVQYCRPSHISSSLSDQMNEELTKLYSSILRYLSRIIHYFEDSTIIRFIKSTVRSKNDLEELFACIEHGRKEVSNLSRIAHGQMMESIHSLVDQLAIDQKAERPFQQGEFDKLSKLLDELSLQINRVSSELQAIRDGLERNERSQILKGISSIPVKTHHKLAKQDRLEGSGRWLLRKEAFRQWRHQSSSSVLWLHGIPGSGKTKLVSLVIDELEACDNLAIFYCMRSPAEPQRGQANKVMASIVRQLAMTRKKLAILPPLVAKYDEALSGLAEFEDYTWTLEDCEEVFVQLMEYHSSVTLVIDALDEVDQDDRQDLMNVLSRLIRNSPGLLKIFVSSRDDYDILLHLNGCPNIYIEADDNDGDIKAFIQNELGKARLLNGKLPESLHQHIVETLSLGARGMFRWVALQIQFLRPLKVAADIETQLGVLPTSLEESYWVIFQQIQASGDHAANLAKFAFQCLMYAEATLSAHEIAELASGYLPHPSLPHKYTAPEVFDVCSSLVTRRSDAQRRPEYTEITFIPVREDHFDRLELSHLSVREFFETLPQRGIDTFLPGASHAALAAACVRRCTVDTFPQLGGLKPNYAWSFWHIHVMKCGSYSNTEPLKDLLAKFIFGNGYISLAFTNWCNWSTTYRLRKKSLSQALIRLYSTSILPTEVFADSHFPEPLLLACDFNLPGVAEMACKLRSQYYNNPSQEPETALFSLEILSTHDYQESPIEAFQCAVASRHDGIATFIGRHISSQPVKYGIGKLDRIAPLIIAVRANRPKLLDALLSQEHGGLTAELFAAVEAVNNGCLKAMSSLNHHTRFGLFTTRQCNVIAAVRDLNEHRKFINYGPQYDRTMDIIASSFENWRDASSTPLGTALLCAAAYNKTPHLIEFLLDRGIGLGALPKALIITTRNGDDASSGVLMRHGAKRDDKMAVTGALIHSDSRAAMKLITAGFPIGFQCLNMGRTPLHYAAANGLGNVATRLLQMNVAIDVPDKDGKTPLHLAAENGRILCISVLLDYGADVLVKDRNGKLPLNLARASHKRLAESLIRNRLKDLMNFKD